MRRNSASRVPFSPLTNSMSQMRSESSDIDNFSLSREKRVLFYDSASSLNITKSSKEAGEKNQNETISRNISIPTEQMMEYTVEYPTTVKLSSSVLYSAYKQAMKYGTHQRHLCEANCDQLSFVEVMIPSIFKVHNMELKILEGKAKGRKAVNVEKKMRDYRCLLKNCEGATIAEVKKVMKDRKVQIRMERKEQEDKELNEKEKATAERRKEWMKVKEEKKRQKLTEKEIRRKQRTKEYKKNRELWKEVATLMADLGRIEKEEKNWTDVQLFESASQLLPDKGSVRDEEQPVLSSTAEKCEEFNTLQSIVDGITTSANRIHSALSFLPSIIEDSDCVRKQVYQKYKAEHKFDGYRAHKDPKALIRALTLD